MKVNWNRQGTATLENEEVEKVEEFLYLGSLLTKEEERKTTWKEEETELSVPSHIE